MPRIGIIGQGRMARAHAHAWSELGLGAAIRYVCAPRIGAPIEHAPKAQFVTDIDVVLADKDVDIVSVCTPSLTHADIAIRSLAAGKNVLLEKPIALTMAEAFAIQNAAAQSAGVLMVAHVVRFFEGYRVLREEVEAGAIGGVVSARAERLSAAPGASSWWNDESKSGGVVVDFSIHDFDQLNLFLGRPLNVSARRVMDGPIEVAVDYEGGKSGQAVGFMGMPPGFSFVSSLELFGARGLADHQFVGAPEAAESADIVRLVTADGVEARPIVVRNPYVRQAEYFLDCVRGGSEPAFCPTDSAMLALAVSLAARDSLASGQDVLVAAE